MSVYDRNEGTDLPELWYLDYQLTAELAARFEVPRRCREPANVTTRALAARVEKQRKLQVRQGSWSPQQREVVTFSYCVAQRLAYCESTNVSTVRDIKQRLTKYALPHLGKMAVTAVRRTDIEEIIMGLRNEGRLAPRSIIHVYEDMRAVFAWACTREPPLLDINPCRLNTERRKGDGGVLPKKKDADPRWRRNAKFEIWEVEVMIGAPLALVPIDRLVFYVLMLLTGSRVGEVCGLRVRDYDRHARPLPRLHITDQGDGHELKGDGNPREVPVHALLWDLLEYWVVFGFPALMGRQPRPEDYLIPSRLSPLKHRSVRHMYNKLQMDLARLGLPLRSNHDARRGFISMLSAFKCSEQVVKAITHEGVATDSAEVFRNYTIHNWDSMCEEMQRVKLTPRELAPGGGSVHSPYAFLGAEARSVHESLPPLPLSLRGSATQPSAASGHRPGHRSSTDISNSAESLRNTGGVDGARSGACEPEVSGIVHNLGAPAAVLGDKTGNNIKHRNSLVTATVTRSLATELRAAADAIRRGALHENTAEWRERLAAACEAAADLVAPETRQPAPSRKPSPA
jgi:integrase